MDKLNTLKWLIKRLENYQKVNRPFEIKIKAETTGEIEESKKGFMQLLNTGDHFIDISITVSNNSGRRQVNYKNKIN